jgi:serine/threonine protein kinase
VTAYPAHQLDKVILPDNWVVVGRAPVGADSTGSFFSVGYMVESAATGDRAFLKALNLVPLFEHEVDVVEALKAAVNTVAFEKTLCEDCRGMTRVVRILDAGQVRITDGDPFSVVPYLIFEQADGGDARRYLSEKQEVEVSWPLRTLHNVATGLNQLHGGDIAHQDLKPSNVLVFKTGDSKVGDLGRASRRSSSGPYDDLATAGAIHYAPPELLYGQFASEFNERRLACDMYLLGSLLAFFFTSMSMTALWMGELENDFRPIQFGGGWAGDYSAALPPVQQAFGKALERFRAAVPEKLQDELTTLLTQLCDPDPKRRGAPGARGAGSNRYNLEYFISRFDNLAKRAEARAKLKK